MGTRADFYKVAAENHVEVLRYPMPIIGSMSTEVNGACYIGLDNSKPCTYAEEQARIGHELGHCLYGGFYSMATPFDIVERHEVRADHWYIRHAIPKQVLFDLLKQGRDADEIAELLDTMEEYVRRAYYYYKENEDLTEEEMYG